MEPVILENSLLRLTLYPEKGGKIASLLALPEGTEFVAQSSHSTSGRLKEGMAFEEGEAAGLDDVFPSMGEDACEGLWGKQPDHGWVWTGGMECRKAGKEEAVLHVEHDGWDYEKRVSVQKNEVMLNWRIRNMSDRERPWVWVFHGLWKWAEDTVFFFPDGNVMDVLDAGEKTVPFPVCPKDGGMAKYYWKERVKEGRCGFILPREKLRLTLTFDPQELPYLGFWITNGGWHGDRNFAFEPATGLYDTLARARRSGTMKIMKPEEETGFSIRLSISRENESSI